MTKKEHTTITELFQVLDLLESLDMQFWLDGGWGVDVLYGQQTDVYKRQLRLREFDHIGRHQQVLVHQKSAPLLSRSPGRRRGGRKRDYQSFHSRLHIKKVNR